MKAMKLNSTVQIIRPRTTDNVGTSNARELYKTLCNSLKIQTISAILESLSYNQIELNIDELPVDTLMLIPKIISKTQIDELKLWNNSFEKVEFARLKIRRARIGKEAKFNSDSPIIVSRLFFNLSKSVSSKIKVVGLFGLKISTKMWTRVIKAFSGSLVEKLSLNYCEISDKEIQSIAKYIGTMSKLKILDLSHNKIKDGYVIGRIISKQGERRDTLIWEGGLREEVAEFPSGLDEVWMGYNMIDDYGWEKLMIFITSDNWLRFIDCKSNLLGTRSIEVTLTALENNKTLLVMDLRGNKDLDEGYIRVLEAVDKNFELVKDKKETYEKYLNMFETICNEADLPDVVEIKAIRKLVKKKNGSDQEKRSSSVYLERISMECEKLKEENAVLRKKMARYDDYF